MTKKKPYYHNNWREYKEAPDCFFIPLTYDEFMDWKIGGWQLPSSVSCIIRERKSNGKIKEHAYKNIGNAQRKIKSLLKEGTSEFTVCDNDAVQLLHPNHKEDLYDDPLA
mgnify:FL=1|tara:strand:+ start:1745 stop:2074 length:330 start_codon:yes stop_codon:yes gene_type:complete